MVARVKPKRTPVTEWPAYLLIGLEDDLRAKVNQEAFEENLAVVEVIRRALCAHYKMRCRTPQGAVYRTSMGERLTLRLQPLLWEKMKEEAGTKYGGLKALIVRVLEAHYE